MRQVISLGYKCETAFQLRVHTGVNRSQFFDWMMTPGIESVIRVLQRDFDVFAPEDLVVVTTNAGQRRIRDIATDVFLPHAFPVRNGHVVENFLDFYTPFAAKMHHLAGRFRETVASGPVTLVRRDATQAQAEVLEKVIFERFPDADVRFLYVLAGGDAFATEHGHACLIPQHGDHGDFEAWARVLVEEGLTEQPYRLSISEIVGFGKRVHDMGAGFDGLEQAETAVRRNPHNPYFHYEAAIAAAVSGDDRRAKVLIDQAAAMLPGNVRILSERLRIDNRLGLLAGTAYIDGLQAIDTGGDSDLTRQIITELLQLRRRPEALPYFARALTDNPFDAGMLTQKAFALYDAGELEAAERAIDLALRLNADQGIAHHLKSVLLRAREDFEAAVAAGREAVRLSPGNITVLKTLAKLFDHMNDFAEASAAYEALQTLDPLQAPAYRAAMADMCLRGAGLLTA